MTKKYIPGSYSAEATGMSKVKVNITVNQDKITDVKLDTEGESKNFGQAAMKELRGQILEAQSPDIDGVSGASLTTKAVREATKEALEQASGKGHEINLNLKDGTFTGESFGHGGPLEVTVTTDNNQIKDVKVTKQTESPNVADRAMENIPAEIVKQQTLGVDAITGATLTSRAVLNAAEDAIKKADGDVQSWKMQDYKDPNDYQVSDMTADLVIMGAGISGLATGVFTIKHGLKPVIIEKNGQVGGSFRYSAGGYALANSKKLHDQGYDDSIDNVMKYVHGLNDGNTSNYIDEDFVEYLMSRTGETFDQLTDILQAKPEAQPFFAFEPYLHATFGGAAGAHEADLMQKYILDNGGKIFLNASVKDAIVEDGKVTGLVAEHDGHQFKVTAKYVVFASGGTSHGKEAMMDKVTPGVANVNIFNEANVGNTGDGYDILTKIGARKDGEDVYKNGFLDFDTSLLITWANVPSYAKAIVIDKDGHRFTNEAPSEIACLSTEMFKEGSSAYYLILDDNTIDPSLKTKLEKAKTGKKIYEKANSIEELAAKIDIDPQVLKDTVETYNANARKGKDPFGKNKDDLQEVTGQGGYYAIYVMPGSWGTMGGVKVNRNMQVERNDGSHFDNVFAVGETSTGDLFSEYYMGGFSLAYYSTEGRLVAEFISK